VLSSSLNIRAVYWKKHIGCSQNFGGISVKQYKIIITQYSPKYAEETVKMWRDSKEKALGQKAIHSVEDHVYFLNHI
jgi:hypothetical protein